VLSVDLVLHAVLVHLSVLDEMLLCLFLGNGMVRHSPQNKIVILASFNCMLHIL